MKIVIEIPDDMIKSLEQGNFGAKYNIYDLVGYLMNGTPLLENHGRLIDADALKNKIIYKDDVAYETWDELYDSVLEEIDNAPTIIEGVRGMTHSLKSKVKSLCYKGEITEKERDRIIKALKQEQCDDMGEVSDGYHTFNQLYHQRAVLFATIVNQNKDKSWKSFKHSDGNYCFDSNREWFIVGIDTPEGSYTYHYAKEYWDMFDCQELECGKEWDGHTEEDVTRLLSLQQQYCEDCISRDEAINVVHKYFVKYLKINDDICLDGIRSLPSVTPKFTDAEIQKMQELEQAQLEKAYELGKVEIQQCEDCISREDAKNLFWDGTEGYDCRGFTRMEIGEMIDDMPSVTPQRLKGKWIIRRLVNPDTMNKDIRIFECPKCGIARRELITDHEFMNYCPNCGAKMEGYQDDR